MLSNDEMHPLERLHNPSMCIEALDEDISRDNDEAIMDIIIVSSLCSCLSQGGAISLLL